MGEGKKKKEKSGDGASDGECNTSSIVMACMLGKLIIISSTHFNKTIN
jgi:hypothetical protein